MTAANPRGGAGAGARAAAGGADADLGAPAGRLPAEWEGLADAAHIAGPGLLLDLLAASLRVASGFAQVLADPGGKVLLWSEGAARLYGHTATEALGRLTLADLFQAGPASATVPQALRVAVRDGIWTGVVAGVRKNGEQFQARIVIGALRRRKAHGLMGFAVAARDVGAEIRGLSSARAEAFRRRSIIQAAALPLMVCDLTGVIQEVNPAAEAITGRGHAQLVGAPLGDCFTDPQAAIDLVRRALSGSPVPGQELDLLGPGGQVVPVLCTAAVVEDEAGRPDGISVRVTDSSGQKRLEDELHRARDFYQDMLEAVQDGLVVLDGEGRRLEVSDLICRETGIAREELVGTPFADSCTDPEAARRLLKQAFASGLVRDQVLPMRFAHGVVRQISWTAWTRQREAGPQGRLYMIARDVTEHLEEVEQVAWERAYNRGLIEVSTHGLATVDFRGRIADVNARMCRMLGQDRQQLVGMPFAECFTDPDAANEVIHRTLVAGEIVNYPLRLADPRAHPRLAQRVGLPEPPR